MRHYLRLPFALSILNQRSCSCVHWSHPKASLASATRFDVLAWSNMEGSHTTYLELHKSAWQVLLLILFDLNMARAKLREHLLEVFSQLLGWDLGRETVTRSVPGSSYYSSVLTFQRRYTHQEETDPVHSWPKAPPACDLHAEDNCPRRWEPQPGLSSSGICLC